MGEWFYGQNCRGTAGLLEFLGPQSRASSRHQGVFPVSWFPLFRKSMSNPRSGKNYGSYEPMNNFTPRAQQALALARKEADRLNHNFVGTEHLLLGLISLGQGVAVTVLRKLGVDLERTREEVEKQVIGLSWKAPF